MTRQQHNSAPNGRLFWSVGFLLFTSAWAANHFSSMLPVLRVDGDLSAVIVNSAYGIYAIGLLPGFLGGGRLVDAMGPRKVVVSGASCAAIGNLLMAWNHDELGILVGRFIVGLGVGLTTSAGTAWAAQLRGVKGATAAGIILTAGFASGPITTSAVSAVFSATTRTTIPLLISAALSLAAIVFALSQPPSTSRLGAEDAPAEIANDNISIRAALVTALPMGLWVFSCTSVAFVVIPERMSISTDLLVVMPGIAAAICFAAGLAVQIAARKNSWGARTGVVGALLATAGFAAMASTGMQASVPLGVILIVVFGSAYGLSLREGLVDVDLLSPAEARGRVIGLFYVVTYLGFALPLALEVVLPSLGASWPFVILAGLALSMAGLRAAQLKWTTLLRR